MSWQSDEVWLDNDVLWFREQPRRPFVALAVAAPAFSGLENAFQPLHTGLEASRRRRLEKQAARRRRVATRTAPALALALGSSVMLPLYALRQGGAQAAQPLQEDPPSLTFRLDLGSRGIPEAPFLSKGPASSTSTARAEHTRDLQRVDWHRATSIGVPHSGRLADGTQLPVEGTDWVTWDPVTDSRPNVPLRLYGHEHTVRTILSVVAAYRQAHPAAPRVVIGDISFRQGGTMDEHVSHQNGLDVDVYYPRLDRRLSAPIATSQIDRRLAQDLLDRFLARGAQIVFVGYSTGLEGPGGVVVPYANHENHMHVRFPPPPG